MSSWENLIENVEDSFWQINTEQAWVQFHIFLSTIGTQRFETTLLGYQVFNDFQKMRYKFIHDWYLSLKSHMFLKEIDHFFEHLHVIFLKVQYFGFCPIKQIKNVFIH